MQILLGLLFGKEAILFPIKFGHHILLFNHNFKKSFKTIYMGLFTEAFFLHLKEGQGKG